MAKQVTRWRPDTCSCIIEYQWDDSVSADKREHTLEKVVRSCPEHNTGTDEDKFNGVLRENQVKNRVLGEVAKSFAATHLEKNAEGNDVFKRGFEPSWKYDQSRNLVITIPQSDIIDRLAFEAQVKVTVGESRIIVK